LNVHWLVLQTMSEEIEVVAKQLCDAAKEGNISQVLRFLAAAAANGTSEKLLSAEFGCWDETALHAACEAGHLDVVLALLLAKANLEATDRFGRTALYRAIEHSHQVAIVKALLEH